MDYRKHNLNNLICSFDREPCLDSTFNDLSLEKFQDYLLHHESNISIDKNYQNIKVQLSSLGFYDLRFDCATYAGILTLSEKNPHFWLPGAYIHIVQYEGENVATLPLFEKKIQGDLFSILKNIDVFFATSFVKMNELVVQKTVNDRKLVNHYPIMALQELLINSIIHREYQSTMPIRFNIFSNHIEIINSGGLYGEVKNNFNKLTSYRNPLIANVIRDFGYCNNYGSGINIAKKELAENKNSDIEFDYSDDYFSAIIKK